MEEMAVGTDWCLLHDISLFSGFLFKGGRVLISDLRRYGVSDGWYELYQHFTLSGGACALPVLLSEKHQGQQADAVLFLSESGSARAVCILFFSADYFPYRVLSDDQPYSVPAGAIAGNEE